MTLNPAGGSSKFRDGRLKLGTYKIQNLYSRTFIDIEEGWYVWSSSLWLTHLTARRGKSNPLGLVTP